MFFVFVKGVNVILSTVKSLNNNLVLAVNEKDEEFVLFGTGIGFKKKKGDPIDETLVTKTFLSNENQNMLAIIENIDPEVLDVTEKIVAYGENLLNKKINASIILALTDHIQFAIKREREGMEIKESNLQWEIPFLYAREYAVGKQALEIIQSGLGVLLPELEASFIALHFVNAQDGMESMDDTLLITNITKSMVKTIQTLFGVSLNKESLNYSRFVTHIRYFMNRQLHGTEQNQVPNEKLYGIIQEQYPKSYACGLVIREMLSRDYGFNISDDKMIYLMIHIERVVKDTQHI